MTKVRRKKMKLGTKLTLSYLLIGLLCILMMLFVANSFLEQSFIKYVIRNQENKNLSLVEQISGQIDQRGNWNVPFIESLGINALEQGVLINVTKSDGTIVWDAFEHNSGMCEQMISHMAIQMVEKVPNWEGEIINSTYEIETDGSIVGIVTIGYYGPYYYSDTDAAFLDTLNSLLLVVSVLTVFLALGVGAFMARKISWPLSRVTEIAEEISEGNYKSRIELTSSTSEIDKLILSVDNMAASLDKQEQLRQKLTTDVAHELRTPLATLQSHMEAMIDGIWKPDVSRLSSCHDEIVRLSTLVGDLEKLAYYERETADVAFEPFNLNQCIETQISHFESAFIRKNAALVFNHTQDIILYGNRNQMSQVIVNLLSNALKYSREGGKVIVETSSDDRMVFFSVEDFGEGIPEDHLPHIFERFYRADPSRSRITGGAGIGLAIVKTIVTAHGGKIHVKSVSGQGSKFTVELPKFKMNGEDCHKKNV